MGKVRAGFAFLVAAAPVASAQQLTFTEASVETGIVATQVMAPGMLQPGNIAGGAVGDFNNDWWQDLLVLSGGVDPDRLYINNGDGTFSDVSEASGIRSTASAGLGVIWTVSSCFGTRSETATSDVAPAPISTSSRASRVGVGAPSLAE